LVQRKFSAMLWTMEEYMKLHNTALWERSDRLKEKNIDPNRFLSSWKKLYRKPESSIVWDHKLGDGKVHPEKPYLAPYVIYDFEPGTEKLSRWPVADNIASLKNRWLYKPWFMATVFERTIVKIKNEAGKIDKYDALLTKQTFHIWKHDYWANTKDNAEDDKELQPH
jgi:hypothetical protein